VFKAMKMKPVWTMIGLCLGALVGFLCGLLRFNEFNLGVAQFGALIGMFATLWILVIGEALKSEEKPSSKKT